jgi:flagella basal body P-ring formation protein FlgA
MAFCYSSANAAQQSLTSIKLQAESFVAEYPYQSPYPAQINLSKLDKRLKLRACDTPLKISFTRPDKTMGNTSLSVSCATPVNWQLYLPVRVDVFDDVLVNKTPLARGQTIDAHAVVYRKENIARLTQGFFRRGEALQKLEAKRNIPARTVLTPAHLAPRHLVKSGQRVTIVLDYAGLQVKSSGVALQSASLGQTVKVKNTHSNKIVEGVVSAEGQINVRL